MSSKEWKKTKTIYWSDELNDDFDETLEKRPPVPKLFYIMSSLNQFLVYIQYSMVFVLKIERTLKN